MSIDTITLKIGERVLANGLTLLAVQNTAAQTFACIVSLLTDRRDEAVGEHGLAHMVGSCLEEGTKTKDATAMALAVDSIGGSLSGASSGGVIQVPAQVARKGVALLHEMITDPGFTSRTVRRVREEILAELAEDREDPASVAHERFQRLVYGKHPFARPLRGTAKTVGGFRPEQLRRFHGRCFTPVSGYVAAAGPGEVDATLDLLQKRFGNWRGKPLPRGKLHDPVLPSASHDEHVPMKREQIHVYLGHIGIRRTDNDFYALQVMDHVLGSGPGFTSRIARSLRDDKGLCYSVHASITASAADEPGAFEAYIGTSAKHRQAAIDGFLAEMRRMRHQACSAQELRDVQDYLTGSFVFGLERNVNLARYAIRAKRFDLGFDYLHEYPHKIRAVTAADVQAAARRHLHPSKVTIVSAGAS